MAQPIGEACALAPAVGHTSRESLALRGCIFKSCRAAGSGRPSPTVVPAHCLPSCPPSLQVWNKMDYLRVSREDVKDHFRRFGLLDQQVGPSAFDCGLILWICGHMHSVGVPDNWLAPSRGTHGS